jgi:Transglycosylase-like domain
MRSMTLMSVLAVAPLAVPAIAADAATTTTAAGNSEAQAAEMHKRLVAKDHELAKRKAYLHHRHVTRGRVAITSTWSNRQLVRHIHKLRRHVLGPAANAAVRAKLNRIARCESRGNPHAVNPTGTYRGKYQMSMRTWRVVGGHGDPAAAPEWEQDRRAAILLRRYGAGQWPVCGYR